MCSASPRDELWPAERRKLGEKKVDILPPDPIGEIGSGWGKIQRETGMKGLPVLS